jgi:hypothetical protein
MRLKTSSQNLATKGRFLLSLTNSGYSEDAPDGDHPQDQSRHDQPDGNLDVADAEIDGSLMRTRGRRLRRFKADSVNCRDLLRDAQKAGLAEFNLDMRPDVSANTVHARPGCVLVAVRDYNRLSHLLNVLQKTNLRRHDIVVMTVRPVSTGAGECDVNLLGEAYAFGVVWSFFLKSTGVLVLRFKRHDQGFSRYLITIFSSLVPPIAFLFSSKLERRSRHNPDVDA